MIAPELRLVRKLGNGGMGVVWLAEHQAWNAEVAVKFPTEAIAGDETALVRFQREASALARLDHRHIVKILGCGTTLEGAPYIVTELLEGEDLGDRLGMVRRLSLERAADVLDEICDGLAAAHAAGIAHRDVKPENVFLATIAGRETVKLLDFGIAKAWREPDLDLTSTGVSVGTPNYMSPEQLMSSKHVDHRSDLWSVAVLAYRMVTGQLPFASDSVAALSISIYRGAFRPPSYYDVHYAVDAWFKKALRSHPAARFQSAGEMAASFREAVANREALDAAPRSSLRPVALEAEGRTEDGFDSLTLLRAAPRETTAYAGTPAGAPALRRVLRVLSSTVLLLLGLGYGFVHSQSQKADAAASEMPGAATR